MKKKQQIDAKLVQDFQSGNNEALTLLVKKWHLTFCKKALWIVKDPDLAKDIAQESWTIIINKIGTLKDKSSFGSWALRIVYFQSLDGLRQKNIQYLKQHEYLKDQIASTPGDIEEESKLKLLKAINNLPEQQHIVINLFYLKNYSIKEISKNLNISTGTTKSRLFYAREKLKLILKKK